MTDFDDYQAETSPEWLQRPAGLLWSRILGVVKHGTVEAAKQAVKARFVSLSPPDALLELALDRGLDVGFRETAAALRVRIANAWATWKKSGSKQGMIDAFAAVGCTAEVLEQPDSPVLQWWQFDVVVHPPFPWEGPSPENVPAEYQALFVSLVRKWKPTHAQCRRLLVDCYAETWAQRQARRITWATVPPEPWTGKTLVVQEGIL